MNKLITLLIFLEYITMTLSQDLSLIDELTGVTIQAFDEEDDFTSGIIISPDNFLTVEFDQDIGNVILNEEELGSGGFTEGILLNPDDNLVIEWVDDPGAVVIFEEENEFGEFITGVVIGADGFLIPRFEDDIAGTDVMFAEEEVTIGDWKGLTFL